MIKLMNVKIKGSQPILMHNVQSMLLKKPMKYTHEEWEKSPECFEAKMYTNGDSLVIPMGVLKGLLISAAKKSGLRVPGKRSGYVNAIKAGVFMESDASLGQTKKDAKPVTRFVTLNKSKVMRVWPSVQNWEAEFNLGFDSEQISEDALQELLAAGGRICGIGDYRPEFGRFEVKKATVR